MLSTSPETETAPVAWIASHPDRGLNLATMAYTQQGATSRLMMTDVAGDHGWSVIPLYVGHAQTLGVGLTKAMEIVGNMRQAEAGLFDAKHSGQRGCDRSDALYDAYVAIRAALADTSTDREENNG